MSKILKQKEYKTAAQILKNGGVIAFPTETVFGLGVIWNNPESYKHLIEIKRRPPEKPFTLMCCEIKDIEKYAIIDETAKKLINKFMPGQFTIILPAKDGIGNNAVANGLIGIRVSSDKLVSKLIKEVGEPLFVPSANRSNEKPATTTKEVIDVFDGEIDAIIEGESVSNVPSTIVMVVDNKVTVLRHGQITEEEIAYAIKE